MRGQGEVLDLIIWFAIAVVGLVTAYVTFGVLSSSASGDYQGIAVGGAIAGAIVSWGVLLSVFLQVRSSSGELRTLRRRVEELQHKVIRGAPCPAGFETEVAERHRIVLARPREWEPRGGTIFDLGLPHASLRASDCFPAVFKCHSTPLVAGSPSREDRYAKEISYAEEAQQVGTVSALTYERFDLGGEAAPVESIKVSVRQYAEIRTRTTGATTRPDYEWRLITRDDYFGNIDSVFPPDVPVGAEGFATVYGTGLRAGIVATVGGREREAVLLQSYHCLVWISEEDTKHPGELLISVRNADVTPPSVPTVVLRVRHREEWEEDGDSSGLSSRPEEEELARSAEKGGDGEWEIAYREIFRMVVTCQHDELQTVYQFDFADDIEDYGKASRLFNQVLASTRFLG